MNSRWKVGTYAERGDRVRTKRSISPTTSASSVRTKAAECPWISTKDHPIVRRMMTYLASSYHPNEWSYSGPAMFQSVVLKFCHKRNPLRIYPLFLCPDIRVLPKKYLYPYTFAHWKRFFRSNVRSDDRIFKSYAVHTYNKLSKKEPVFVRSNQLYNRIARVHCPATYTHALSNLKVDFF